MCFVFELGASGSVLTVSVRNKSWMSLVGVFGGLEGLVLLRFFR